MTRFYLTLFFSAASVAGAALVLYAILTGSRRNRESIGGETITAGLSDAAREPGMVLDLDIGHEGLKHREKEPFDPDKHKPESIEARKKIS
jgi:hypothetical protein